MRFSNKSTLFLCLILMSVFMALPVIAHQLTADDVPGTEAEKTAAVNAHNEDPHDPNDTAHAENHALVKSITVSSMFLTTRAPITATVTFADGVAEIEDDTNTDDTTATTGDDNEARHATLSDPATDLAIGTLTLQYGTRQADGTYTWVATHSSDGARITQVIKTTVEGTGETGSGSVYTVYIAVPETLAPATVNDGKYRIFAATDVSSAGGIYNPGVPQGTAPTAAMPSVKGEFTMDTVSPVVGTVNVGPQPGGDLIPVSGQLSDPFRLTFDVTIPDPTSTTDPPAQLTIEDLKSITFMADPDVLMFGTPGSLGGSQYAVDVDYKNVDVAADTEVEITITATDMAGNSVMMTTMVTLAARTMTDDDDDDDDDMEDVDPNLSPAITIPKESFIVVVRDITKETGADGDVGQDAILRAYGIADEGLTAWPMMPDLQDLFDTNAIHGAGALFLMDTAEGDARVDPGTVGISEIMWAIDLSRLGQAGPQRHAQWIELHNLNTEAVTVKLSYVKGAKKIGDDDGEVDFLRGDLDKPYLDAVTNAFNNRPGSDVWSLPGDNGNPRTGTDFVSAARKGTFNLTKQHDGKHNQRYTKTGVGNSANSQDGRNKDQWAKSTTSYARGSHTLGSGLGNVFYDYVGTPGRVNSFSPERAERRDARTDIPASPIIINEVANRDDANSQYEWIELKNVSDAEVNLNNYQISILTAVDKDEPFIFLPNNNDSKIPPGGVLLLVDSDPFGDDDHPLAVGWKIGKNEGNQVPGLASIGIDATSKEGRYLVVPFGGKNNKFINGLPDDGNFILVVRSWDNHEGDHGNAGKGRAELGKDDLDKITDIAGYAGTLTKDNYTNSASKTDLWPLKEQRTGALISDRNKLTVNTVHYRARNGRNGLAGVGTTHNDRNEGQVAYQHAGYTGIGYKRQVSNSGMHGGTPGYDNGAQKGRVSDLATTKLVISEIMLSQGAEGARTTLPQWIEIYNPSPHPVGLGGWKLIIENPRDPIRTINLGGGTVKTILSKQTILVVSGSARDFGSGNLVSAAAKVFPATRVYNVYQHQKNEFNMDSRFDPILNQEAFHITLIDGSALDLGNDDQKAIADDPTKSLRVGGNYFTISDVVGNLDGNPRTNDTPEDNGKMAFPMGMTEDGNRTSLIRVFDNGVARDGTGAVKPLGGTDGVDVARMKGIDSKYSWVHAADTDFAYADRNIRATTWYGARSDSGTPLNRIGQILPVSLSHFRPELENGEVVIRWTTESELDNAGFNILRSDTRNGEFKQVNAEMIQGNGTTGERSTYKWVDASAKPGVVYYYQIEDVSFAGERQTLQTTKLKGYISAVGKATTTWGDIKEVQ